MSDNRSGGRQPLVGRSVGRSAGRSVGWSGCGMRILILFMDRSEDLHSLLGLMILGQDDRPVGRSVIDLSNVLHSLLARSASCFMGRSAGWSV